MTSVRTVVGVRQLVGQRLEPVLAPCHQGDAVSARASSRAISAPMPDEAPVTRAVVFSFGVGSAMGQSVGDRAADDRGAPRSAESTEKMKFV